MINGVQIDKKVITRIPTKEGTFNVHLYHSSKDPSKDHMALVYGDISSKEVLVRVHSECFTGEVLGSLRCDCKEQLQTAQHLVAKEGSGVIIYLRQEGRGIGLLEKLKAYNLQDQGLDTVDANLALGHQSDARTYEEAALMLKDLGIESVRLLTNNPEKVKNLSNLGINVTKRVAMMPKELTFDNMSYLVTKIERMSHMLPIESFSTTAGSTSSAQLSSSPSSSSSSSSSPSSTSFNLQQTPPISSEEEDNDESENIKKIKNIKSKTKNNINKTTIVSVN